MRKTIIVEAKGKKITGTVADKSDVTLASAEDIDNSIVMGANDIAAMLAGEVPDPTQKRCSRCVKMGRVPYHSIEDFSLLKNGKRHSQCKVCRVEQSDVWYKKRAEHRREYHRKYHQTRPQRTIVPKGIKALMDVYTETEAIETKIDATNALFVGFPDVDDIQETS
jgi:hypothetical protein